MKALFVAITLLTAVTASAQTAPTIAPPPGQATGTAPPSSSSAGFRGDDNNELRRGRRSTLVVVDREEMERHLADLESLIGEAFERGGGRGGGRGKLREAYEELKDIRELLADAPDVRGYDPRPSPPPPPPPPAYQPIADGRLQKILGAMSREPFGEDKMNVLEDASRDNYFLVSQVQQVLSQFQFSRDRLQAVRLLWSRVLDRQNGFQLYNAFPMSSDKAELKRIISG